MKNNRKYLYLLVLLPFLVVVFFFEVLPLLMIVFNSFIPDAGGSFTLENYATVFSKPLYTKAIFNSIKISCISSAIGIVVAFFGAKAAHEATGKFSTAFMTVLNMVSNFAGVPLAFAYMIMLGNSGVLLELGKTIGLEALANYELYTTHGLTMIYVYFQIPLSTLLLIPAFEGIRREWQESSLLLGAGPMKFWTQVGVPVLLPSILGTISVLFANALAAYATAYALLMNNYALLPINISGMYVGDVTIRKGLGGALSVVMMILMVIMILITNGITKKTQKGVRKT